MTTWIIRYTHRIEKAMRDEKTNRKSYHNGKKKKKSIGLRVNGPTR